MRSFLYFLESRSFVWRALGLALFLGGTAARGDDWHGADAAYLDGVRQVLRPRWSDFLSQLQRLPDPAYQDPARSVDLEFSVAADGAVVDVQRTRASGLPGFDDAPVDLVRDVAQLPPPPHGLLSDDGHCHVRWHFNRKEPGAERGEVIELRLPVETAVPQLVQSGRLSAAVLRTVEGVRGDASPAREAQLARVLGRALGEVAAGDAAIARRRAAAPVLAYFDEHEALLIKLVGDADPSVQRAALQALGGRSGSVNARTVLIDALNRGDSAGAAIGLGQLGDASAIDALRKAFSAGVAPEETAGALGRLGDGVWVVAASKQVLLKKPHERAVGGYAARALKAEALVPALVLAMKGAPDDTRALFVDVLAGFADPQARHAVGRALADEAAVVRAHALRAIRTAPDAHAAATRNRLFAAAKDPDWSVRSEVASLLVELVGATGSDEIAALERDRSPAVRAALAGALVHHPFAGSEKLLERLKRDADKAVRAAAEKEHPTVAANGLSPAASTSLADLDRTKDEVEWLSIVEAALRRAPRETVKKQQP